MKYVYILSRNHNVYFLLKVYVGFFLSQLTNISYRTKESFILKKKQLSFNFYINEEKVTKICFKKKTLLTGQ